MKNAYDQLPIYPDMAGLFQRGTSLTPTAAKLLDILTLELTALALPEAKAGRVILGIADYVRACGYTSPDATLKQLRRDIQLLSSAVLPGGCPLLETQRLSGGDLTVTFNSFLAQQIRQCSRVPFPIALLSMDARKQNSYFLGRCLAEFGQASRAMDVGTLLKSCPYIPSEDEFEGSRSILKRKVADSFTSAMDALQEAGIIVWQSSSLDDSSYQAFADSTVEFVLLNHPRQLFHSDAEAQKSRIHFDPARLLKNGEKLTKTITF